MAQRQRQASGRGWRYRDDERVAIDRESPPRTRRASGRNLGGHGVLNDIERRPIQIGPQRLERINHDEEILS